MTKFLGLTGNRFSVQNYCNWYFSTVLCLFPKVSVKVERSCPWPNSLEGILGLKKFSAAGLKMSPSLEWGESREESLDFLKNFDSVVLRIEVWLSE